MGKRRTLQEFINDATEKHQGKYDYSRIDGDSNQIISIQPKISIICPIHGEFRQEGYNHLRGFGCNACGGDKTASKLGLNLETFIIKSNVIHNNFYSYEKSIYVNSHTPIIVICPLHGEFRPTAGSHMMGTKCLECGLEHRTLTLLCKTKDEFISSSEAIYSSAYDYSRVDYQGYQIAVEIICKDHGIFLRSPVSHLRFRRGCPECDEGSRSRGEVEISRILKLNNILFVGEKTFENCRNPETNRKLFFDFHLPEINTIIEYDGRQHFEPVPYWGGQEALEIAQGRDEIKNVYCSSFGIKLIRITYKDDILDSLKNFKIIP